MRSESLFPIKLITSLIPQKRRIYLDFIAFESHPDEYVHHYNHKILNSEDDKYTGKEFV